MDVSCNQRHPAGIFSSALATAVQTQQSVPGAHPAALGDRHLQFPTHPQLAYSEVGVALTQSLLSLMCPAPCFPKAPPQASHYFSISTTVLSRAPETYCVQPVKEVGPTTEWCDLLVTAVLVTALYCPEQTSTLGQGAG